MTKQFLIVGQGLAGSLLAFNMYKRGISFQIISSENIPKASNVAAGLFNPLVFKRLNKSWMANECLPVMNKTYQELERLLNCKLLYHKHILKLLTEQETDLWKRKISKGMLKEYILDVKPEIAYQGIKDYNAYGEVSQTGHIELTKMLSELKAFFNKEGLFIESLFNFDELKIEPDQVKWKNITAQQIVFCEGYKGKENPFFCNIGLNATKGELLEIYCKDLSEEYILNKNMFVLPIGNNHFKIGATYDWKNINEEITIEAKKELLKRFEDIVSLPYSVVRQYAGIRPTVVDRRPILGCHPQYKNVNIFNGLGTKGVMIAPYLAEEMMHFLTQKKHELSAEFNVNRFLSSEERV